jgi:hypothetical protein
MIEGGSFSSEKLPSLVATYDNQRVKVFMHRSGLRFTEINLANKTITVARAIEPAEFPGNYGEIAVQSEMRDSKFFITKHALDGPPFFLVWDGRLVVGSARGYRLDLALAYGLGVSDEYLVTDMQKTVITLTIPERIAQEVF